ncbi:MAG: phenylalanine--tRNA ligase subunit alpha [Bacteroidia bacterium]|nr:phenylalanine--tRNA ligase subunit alpha [Bacteroidia bacterium]
MLEKLKQIASQIESFKIDSSATLEEYRLKFLVKKGLINELVDEFRTIDNNLKREVGKELNLLKERANQKWEEAKEKFESNKPTKEQTIDVTLPVHSVTYGGKHPITEVIDEISNIFARIGFTTEEGPEIEDDYHNFSALNFPPNHPARDMQDTFFITNDFALRTHTSSVQIRVMKNEKPPIRVICPGRVYRNEAVSARSNCFFHQIEGLCIDKHISFADLKQTLYFFVREFFGKDLPVRFRASYFPFTEPSAEMDVFLGTETEEDYRLTKGTGWLEILGCGMVDVNVLQNVGLDSKIYSGYAFGLGVDRIAMLKYGIKDIRTLFYNDVRFLSQFSSF